MDRTLPSPEAAGLEGGVPASSAHEAAVEAEIRLLEEGLRRAYVANDLPAYFGHFGPDSTALTPDGLVEFPDYESSWSDYVRGGNRVISLDYSNMRVRVAPSGDAAVASFGVRVRIQTVGAGLTDECYLETDIWFRQRGAWRLVHAQYAKPSLER